MAHETFSLRFEECPAGRTPFFALSAASQLTDDSLEQVALELNLGFCGSPTLRGLCEGWDGFDLLQCLHLKPRNNSLLHQACWSELVETPRPRIASMRSTARSYICYDHSRSTYAK